MAATDEDEGVHPRDSFVLEGVDEPAAALEGALDRGRMHHAWLLTGPEGVGKASFAYRAARWLLGARLDPAYGRLGAAPDDATARLIASRSHPDLMVLERSSDKKGIPVDDARRLPEFFSKSPSIAPWRVAIIDAADDLNVNAANAVLKTLEEPPPRGVLFLVSHSPGRLLPTIRSRCRRLAFRPWADDRLQAFIESRLGLAGDDALRLARMAKGAPGRALVLHAADALALDAAAGELLDRLPQADEAGLMAMADKFRGGEGAVRFALLIERLADRVHEASVAGALAGAPGPGLDAWARAWTRLEAIPGEAEAINLDRADAFWSVLADLRAAARTRPFRL
ncbi:MAG TPA: DNA polymerase III subunit delta' [Caulobacteraceae bacterium]|jgi:DNA polymerase-3 subunit delta'|nr:DNA polymerase III subunit delta' [Caulobacteraceae bacterium]